MRALIRSALALLLLLVLALTGVQPTTTHAAPRDTAPTTFTYYVPFLANHAGGYNTYLAIQNADFVPFQEITPTTHLQFSYYNIDGSSLSNSSDSCTTLAPLGECIVSLPLAEGSAGSATIVSDNPLSIIVSEQTPYGMTDYTVAKQLTTNSLVVPLVINNAYNGFLTQLNVSNSGDITSTVNVQFYDSAGRLQNAANRNFSLNPHASQTLYQNANDSGLPVGFFGWAQVTGTDGTSLAAQVLETNPNTKFVAVINSSTTPTVSGGQNYASAIFNNAFGGFNTGTNIVNPNSTPVTVTAEYADSNGEVYRTSPFVIGGHQALAIYQGAKKGLGLPDSGLPIGFNGSVDFSSNGGDVAVVVNEIGSQTPTGVSRSASYLTTKYSTDPAINMYLPAVAHNGLGYTTGFTIHNFLPVFMGISIQYYNLDGTPYGQPHDITIQANSSYAEYQGNTLPDNFYGTAVITETNNGYYEFNLGGFLVTTNAASNNSFYSYVEDGS